MQRVQKNRALEDPSNDKGTVEQQQQEETMAIWKARALANEEEVRRLKEGMAALKNEVELLKRALDGRKIDLPLRRMLEAKEKRLLDICQQ